MFDNIFFEDRVTFDLTNSPSIGIHNTNKKKLKIMQFEEGRRSNFFLKTKLLKSVLVGKPETRRQKFFLW